MDRCIHSVLSLGPKHPVASFFCASYQTWRHQTWNILVCIFTELQLAWKMMECSLSCIIHHTLASISGNLEAGCSCRDAISLSYLDSLCWVDGGESIRGTGHGNGCLSTWNIKPLESRTLVMCDEVGMVKLLFSP